MRRAGSVSNAPYSQRVQTGEVSEGSVGDEADLVVADRELLELAQPHEAALLQAHQLVSAEVAEIHRDGEKSRRLSSIIKGEGK